MKIVLDGNIYQLMPNTGVRRKPMSEFPESTRTTGQQQRTQRSLMSSWEFSKLTWGSGIEKMDADEERDKESYWLSSLDTRWKGKVLLPPYLRTIQVGTTSDACGSVNSLGYMFGRENLDIILAEMAVPTTNQSKFVEMSKAGGDCFQWQSSIPPHVSDMGGSISYLWRTALHDDKGDRYYYVSTPSQTGIMWIPETGSVATMYHETTASTSDPDKQLVGNLHSHLGTIHIGVMETSTNRVFVHPVVSASHSNTDSEYILAANDCHPYLEHTDIGLYVGIDEGIFLLDTTKQTFTKKLNLMDTLSRKNCRSMKTWDQTKMIVPVSYEYGGGSIIAWDTYQNKYQSIGMDLDHAVPSGYNLQTEALETSYKFLFAGFGQDRLKFASPDYTPDRVFAYDRYGWHFMAEVPTNNQPIKQLFLSHNGLYMVPTGAVNPYLIEYPLDDPGLVPSYTFATQGELRWPEFSAGMPEWDTGWYELMFEVDNIDGITSGTISPGTHNDPEDEWTGEGNLYDDDTGTYGIVAITPQTWGDFLELSWSGNKFVDRVWINAHYNTDHLEEVDLDAYDVDEDRWVDIYYGSYTHQTDTQIMFDKIRQISKIRIRSYNKHETDTSNWFVYEVYIGELITGNKVEMYYGLDGATPTQWLAIATTNGAITAQFGDGLGVKSKSIQLMTQLTRGTLPGSSPKLITHNSPVLGYMKYPDTREIFKFSIDLSKSGDTPRSVMDDLVNLKGVPTLVPFYYGNVSTKNVALIDIEGIEVSEYENSLLRETTSGSADVTLVTLV